MKTKILEEKKKKNGSQEKRNLNLFEIKKADSNGSISEEIISRKEVKDTPFNIISLNETNEHFGVMGEYRITEKYDKITKVESEIKKVTWNRIIQVTMILIEKLKDKKTIL